MKFGVVGGLGLNFLKNYTNPSIKSPPRASIGPWHRTMLGRILMAKEYEIIDFNNFLKSGAAGGSGPIFPKITPNNP